MLMRLLPLLLGAVAIVPAQTAGRIEAAAESQPVRISETGGVDRRLSFPRQGGWLEIRDDFTTYTSGDSTFPSIGRAR